MGHEPKLHHYLAEAYLRRFASDDGYLWVFDRKRGEVRRQRPEVTAAEREMYTLDVAEGSDRRVEELLAKHVDGPGLRVIKSLAGGERLKLQDREALATFAAALHLRTPAARELNRQFSELIRDASKRWGIEPAVTDTTTDDGAPPVKGQRHRIPADVLLAEIEKARAAGRPYQNQFVRFMVRTLPKVTDLLMNMNWAIAETPDNKSFITTDAPMVITAPRGYPPHLGVGLATRGSETVIPLTSRIALLVWDLSTSPSVTYGMIDRSRLRELNEALARNSERFTISSSQALLESIVKRTGITRTAPPPRIESVGLPGLPASDEN